MRESLLRTVAPALVIVIEAEGPTRMFSTGIDAPADRDVLLRWIEQRPFRLDGVLALVADAFADQERADRWVRELAREPGIADLHLTLLGELIDERRRGCPGAIHGHGDGRDGANGCSG